jgi:uncharacterized protein (TIGR03067 family)
MTAKRKVLLGFGIVAVALLVVLGVLLVRPDLLDRFALHGTWYLQPDRNSAAAEEVDAVTFQGLTGELTFWHRGVAVDRGTFRLEPTVSPKRLDLAVSLPPGAAPANGWDGVIHMIYEVKGATLKLCWVGGATQPPPAFPEEPAADMRILVLTRTKE